VTRQQLHQAEHRGHQPLAEARFHEQWHPPPALLPPGGAPWGLDYRPLSTSASLLTSASADVDGSLASHPSSAAAPFVPVQHTPQGAPPSMRPPAPPRGVSLGARPPAPLPGLADPSLSVSPVAGRSGRSASSSPSGLDI